MLECVSGARFLAAVEVPISVSESIDGATYTYSTSTFGSLILIAIGIGALGFGIYGFVKEGFDDWKKILVFGLSSFAGALALLMSVLSSGDHAVVSPDYLEITKVRRTRHVDRSDLEAIEFYSTRGRKNLEVPHVVFHLRGGEKLDYTDPFLLTAGERALEMYKTDRGVVSLKPDPETEQAVAAQVPRPAVEIEVSAPQPPAKQPDVQPERPDLRGNAASDSSPAAVPSGHDPTDVALAADAHSEGDDVDVATRQAADVMPVERDQAAEPLAERPESPAILRHRAVQEEVLARQEEIRARHAEMRANHPQREPSKSARKVTKATRLAVGMPVQFQKNPNLVYPVKVVSLEPDGQVKITYPGWSAAFDEIVPRSQLWVEPAVVKEAERESKAKSSDARMRIWRDASGKFEVEAELVRFEDGLVQLRREDGKVLSMPLEKLSEADQQHLQRGQ